jgi:hypothetical protein
LTDDRLEAAGRIFDEVVVEQARRLRERAVDITSRPGRGDTYWRPHSGSGLVRAADVGPVWQSARDRWAEEGLPELAVVGAAVLTLAATFDFDQPEEGDVNPYIYAMF